MMEKESKWKKIIIGIVIGIAVLIILLYAGLALTR